VIAVIAVFLVVLGEGGADKQQREPKRRRSEK
jgi:hypothetical protein